MPIRQKCTVALSTGAPMSRTTSASRWTSPSRRYQGGWHQNPWIDAVFTATQARGETDSSTAPVDAEAVGYRAGSVLSGPATSQRSGDIQDRQQRVAVWIWENEGGSLGTHQ